MKEETKPYQPPTLTLHGTLKELVQGGGSDVFDGMSASGDGGFLPPPPPY